MKALLHPAVRSMALASCLLALGACSPAPRAAAPAARPAVEPVPRSAADAEAAVLRTLEDACDAFLKGDAEAMLVLLTEDFTTTDPDGVVTTRANDIEIARTGAIRYEVFENRDMNVRLHGDAAVVTGRTIVKGQAGTRAFAAEFQFTDTLVKTEGRWRVAATHISRIAQ